MKKKSFILTVLSNAFMLLSSVFLLISLFNCYGKENGYFTLSAFSILYTVFFIIGLVLVAVLYFSNKKEILNFDFPNKKLHLIIYISIATVFIISGIFVFKFFFVNELFKLSKIIRFLVPFGMISFSFYLVSSLFLQKKHSNIGLYCSFFFAIGIVLECIFNYYYHINSFESKAISVFAVIFLIYILEELRASFEGFYRFIYVISLYLLTAYSTVFSIPYIIAMLSGKTGNYFFLSVSISSIPLAAYSVYKLINIKKQ